MLYDGCDRIVVPNRQNIKIALMGNTSQVKTKDDSYSILYNEEVEEINIFEGDNEIQIYPLGEIDNAVKLFLWKVQGEI